MLSSQSQFKIWFDAVLVSVIGVKSLGRAIAAVKLKGYIFFPSVRVTEGLSALPKNSERQGRMMR